MNPSRWTQVDEDSYRLPEGMKRIAYDADTKVYTFRDRDGQLYMGPPGEDYGSLTPIPKTTTITRRGAFADSDVAVKRRSIDPQTQPNSFHDFLPSHSITKATAPVDANPSPLSTSSSGSPEDSSKRSTRVLFTEAVRKTAIPKMQGVAYNLRRSMTSVRRTRRNGEAETDRLLRAGSADLGRSSSMSTTSSASTATPVSFPHRAI